MEESHLLSSVERVEAPAGFEQKVMAQLSLRKRRRVRTRKLSFAITSACASLVIVLLAVNFFILSPKSSQEFSNLERDVPPGFFPSRWERSRAIPITETINYTGEIRDLSHDARTVYILERVSDRTDTKTIY